MRLSDQSLISRLLAIYHYFFHSIQDLFVYQITSVKELALGGNVVSPVSRLKWKTNGEHWP